MNQFNVLELGLRDPSRLTAHLAGHTRHAANQTTVRATRGRDRSIARRRPRRVY